MREVPSVGDARALARELLEPLDDRWAHVQAVAARAEDLSPAAASDEERHLLIVSAWWHDLGYAPALRDTGAHQIDGARYLVKQGYPPRLCALVAHHSAATCEAEERGLTKEIMAWPQEESAVADALWMADMTTGPRGESLAYPERLAEILGRYDADSIVGRAMRRAEPSVRGAIARTQQRMQDAYTT
ncbi:HD domain-containing protein [Pseudonocardia sichuanensis]